MALPRGTTFRFVLLVAAVLAAEIDYSFVLAPPGVLALAGATNRCMDSPHMQAVGSLAQDGGQIELPYMAHQTALGERCVAVVGLNHLWWMLGMLGLLVTATAVFFLCAPWWKIRRGGLVPLPSDGASDGLPRTGLRAELDGLVAEAGLDRPPVFLLDPLNPGVNGLAFGRFGRYYVRLDAGLVLLRGTDPQAFRAIVRHELAHLSNRDVNQTYLAVALWRGFLTTVLVSGLMALADPRLTGDPLSFGTAKSFGLPILAVTALVYAVRGAVLRSRELHADARAAALDPDTALTRVLSDAGASRGGVLGWAAVLTGRHPTPAARRAAIADPARLLRTGFWEAAAAGASIGVAYSVVVFCFGMLYLVSPLTAERAPAAVLAVPVAAVLALTGWRVVAAGTSARGAVLLPAAGLATGMIAGDVAAHALQTANWLLGVLVTGVLLGALHLWIVGCAAAWRPLVRGPSLLWAWALTALTALPVVAAVFVAVLAQAQTWSVADSQAQQHYAQAAAVGWRGPYWLWQVLLLVSNMGTATEMLVFSAAILVWAVPLAGWVWSRPIQVERTAAVRSYEDDRAAAFDASPAIGRAMRVGLMGGIACCGGVVCLQAVLHTVFSAAIRATDGFETLAAYWYLALVLLAGAVVSALLAVTVRHGVLLGMFAAFVTVSLGALGVIGDTRLGGCVTVLALMPNSCSAPEADSTTAFVLSLLVIDGAAVALIAGTLAAGARAALMRRTRHGGASPNTQIPPADGSRLPRPRVIAATAVVSAALVALTVTTRPVPTDLAQAAAHGNPTVPDPKQAANDWLTAGGSELFDAVLADSQRLATDVNSRSVQPNANRHACSVLQQDVAAGLAFAPVPEPAAQQQWARMLTQYQAAVRECSNHASAVHTSAFVSAFNDALAAGNEFAQRINTVAGLATPAAGP